MSWTSEAAAPYTTLLQLTQMESTFIFVCSPLRSEEDVGVKQTKINFLLIRCVEYLLRNDADPGVRDKQGYSAVHYASAYGRTLCLELVRTDFTATENVFNFLQMNKVTNSFCFFQISSMRPLDVVRSFSKPLSCNSMQLC